MPTVDVDTIVRYARAALVNGQTTRARMLIRVTRILPEQSLRLNDYLRIGDTLVLVSEYADAAQYAYKALALNPPSVHARYIIASSWQGVGDYVRALQWCDEALLIAPRDIDCLILKASVQHYRDQNEQSILVAGVAIALDPDNAVAWHNSSTALLDLQRYQDAIEAARRASALRPERADPWSVQGRAWFALGDYAAAEQAYSGALKRERWRVQSILGLTDVYGKQGRRLAALRLWLIGQVVGAVVRLRRVLTSRHVRKERRRLEQLESLHTAVNGK